MYCPFLWRIGSPDQFLLYEISVIYIASSTAKGSSLATSGGHWLWFGLLLLLLLSSPPHAIPTHICAAVHFVFFYGVIMLHHMHSYRLEPWPYIGLSFGPT